MDKQMENEMDTGPLQGHMEATIASVGLRV